ncbi:MAG: hypothetical protein AB1631_03050 [Acidobacteriota bacterium]
MSEMILPEFDDRGDLPEGIYRASLKDVIARFGHGSRQREFVTQRLTRIYELAQRTGKLERFIIFGSYVTAKPEPNDVDILLVMSDDFLYSECDEETALLFDNQRAQRELGASVFFIRTTTVLLETVDEFIAYWQTKRDKSLRGIIEVVTEDAK